MIQVIFELLVPICMPVVLLPYRKVVFFYITMTKFVAILCKILLINLTLLSSTFAQPGNTCNSINVTAQRRLRTYLFCDYQSWYLPTIDEKNGVDIYITLAPKMANFIEEDGNLEINGLFLISWQDSHFIWNASEFDGLYLLKLHSYDMWQPDLAVISAGNENANNPSFPFFTCHVFNGGLVFCAPRIRHTIRCHTDFTQWPFDRQNCTLVISTWLRSNQQIRFINAGHSTVLMDYFISNGEWKLTASRVFYDQRKSSYSQNQGVNSPRLSIDFILDRVHNHLSGRFISPAIIVMVMTLTTLWLDPRSIERLSVACVNPIIHLFCIQDLHGTLPHNGATVPNLLLFYAYSLVLATTALLLTFVLGNLQKLKIEPPTWISSLTVAILRSKVGQILLLSMLDPKIAAEIEPNAADSDELMRSNAKTTAWGYVAIMCGWISFLTFLLTYVIMYAVLIPNSSTRPPVASIAYNIYYHY